jgi:hypothetical protein
VILYPGKVPPSAGQPVRIRAVFDQAHQRDTPGGAPVNAGSVYTGMRIEPPRGHTGTATRQGVFFNGEGTYQKEAQP